MGQEGQLYMQCNRQY